MSKHTTPWSDTLETLTKSYEREIAELKTTNTELLEALEDIVAAIADGYQCDLCRLRHNSHTDDCPMPRAQAAIAKARDDE